MRHCRTLNFSSDHLAAGSSLAFQQVRNASLHFGRGKTRFYRIECRRIGCTTKAGDADVYVRMRAGVHAFTCVVYRVYTWMGEVRERK